MKLIVGLGNPGKRYKNTRHNVGFVISDKLADKLMLLSGGETEYFSMDSKFDSEILKLDKAILVKPQTFMNDSGKAVSSVSSFYKIDNENLYAVHDDLDIKLGEYKIQKGKGPKDHNGLSSIYKKLGTKEFWHVRIGVENRKVGDRTMGEEYVLKEFGDEEMKIIDKVVNEAVEELNKIVNE